MITTFLDTFASLFYEPISQHSKERERVQDGIIIRKIFDYSKLESPIEWGAPKRYEQKTTLFAKEKGKSIHNIEFYEKSKRR